MLKVTTEKTVAENKPATYALAQNYPNPFNPGTEIRFQLPEDGHVVLKVFNNLGQEVSTIVEANFAAGKRAVRWLARDNFARDLQSGVYRCRIQAHNFVASEKMTLLR